MNKEVHNHFNVILNKTFPILLLVYTSFKKRAIKILQVKNKKNVHSEQNRKPYFHGVPVSEGGQVLVARFDEPSRVPAPDRVASLEQGGPVLGKVLHLLVDQVLNH